MLVPKSCPTLCNPMDCSHQAPLSVGILQARRLEYAVIPRDQIGVSCIAGRFFAIWASREFKMCYQILLAHLLSNSVASVLTLCDRKDCSAPGSSVHENSPNKNTGMGCHALLQEIILTQGSNPPALAGGFFTTSPTWEAQSDPTSLLILVILEEKARIYL